MGSSSGLGMKVGKSGRNWAVPGTETGQWMVGMRRYDIDDSRPHCFLKGNSMVSCSVAVVSSRDDMI